LLACGNPFSGIAADAPTIIVDPSTAAAVTAAILKFGITTVLLF